MKLIVAGDRNFNDYDFIKDKLDYYLCMVNEDIEIVSGKCTGVDTLGEQYAKEKKYPIKEFPADWDNYGMIAGPMRNRKMAEYATHCICFVSQKSKGTKSMIKIAQQKGLLLRVVNI